VPVVDVVGLADAVLVEDVGAVPLLDVETVDVPVLVVESVLVDATLVGAAVVVTLLGVEAVDVPVLVVAVGDDTSAVATGSLPDCVVVAVVEFDSAAVLVLVELVVASAFTVCSDNDVNITAENNVAPIYTPFLFNSILKSLFSLFHINLILKKSSIIDIYFNELDFYLYLSSI